MCNYTLKVAIMLMYTYLILLDGNIDGELFLELLADDNADLLDNELKLSPGGKAHIKKIVKVSI